MLERIFGSDALVAANQALNASALRQQVIANNLANINTPGYRRQVVHFESSLQAALAHRDNPLAAPFAPSLSSVTPEVATVSSTSERTDGNNVDPEAENVALAQNAIKYDALVELTAVQFTNLKTAILGR